ncbi:MAG TPA: HNH endonuclease signature motif containing protein, partial [Acidimicrobiales bacterium]|nr:HNH endonuclease signature motif containing protein [Acidimicrobiales bacterium]
GSIPVAVAQDLLGDAWVELVLRQGTDVTTITSKKRTIPTAVRTALWARDGGRCVVPGCPHTKYLQIDHDRAFARGGPTELANLQLLCSHHHRQKTLYGFRVVRGPDGARWVGPAARAGPGPPFP